MRVRNHKLEGVPYQAARHAGGTIVPTVVILHDTASRLTKGNAADYLADNAAKVAVHFVVERDGSIVQQVPTNKRAGHAGQSTFQGRRGCNEFSIGIEIVNPGRMTRMSSGKARTWFKQDFDVVADDVQEVTTPEHGSGLWMDYPEVQLDAVEALLVALFAGVKTLRDVTTHWYVSPGRKVDTNPLFPLESLRARVLGRDDPADLAADEASVDTAGEFVRVVAFGSTLNMRRWPSFNPNVVAAVPNGMVVPVLRSGLFEGEAWHLIRWDGREGWVVGRYTTPSPDRRVA